MELGAYFDRIGYSGPRAPDLATLDAVMRAHAGAVPFENLDVQLGRPLGIALPAIFAKIVGERRGGWCYEQNGLFGWALGEMGFEVRRISCGVMRAASGDAALGNHLSLIVTIDGREWLADVGFGGSQAAPLPFAAGEHAHAPFQLSLAEAGDEYWRLTEWIDPARPFSFDFLARPADEALLATKCAELQTSAESPFVPNLVVQQRQGDRHVSLRGRVLSVQAAQGETRRLLESAAELVAVLRDTFGLDLPEAAGLWDKVRQRHLELFPAEAA
jgi:N-hydroxyarylamine O-acetyltransferase